MALGIVGYQFVFATSSSILRPSSEGTYLQWKPSVGTTHYTTVDETTCNGNTDYVATTTVGSRDSYGISLVSIPNGSTITDIAITPCASRHQSGSGSAVMDVFYRLNGVNSADAGAYAVSGTTPVKLATTTFSGLSRNKATSDTLQVGAVFTSGDKGARLSQIVVVITYTPLNAPTALDAVNASSSQNNLSWTDNATNEDGFKIERSLNSSLGPWTQIATTTTNTVAYSDTSVSADQTYYYRIRAFNTGGDSSYSNSDYAITASVVPNAPSNLTTTASSTGIALTWTDNSLNEEGFKVERSTDGINFSEIGQKLLNITTYLDLGLASGTYYYQVRAFNAIGNSAYSNTTSTTI